MCTTSGNLITQTHISRPEPGFGTAVFGRGFSSLVNDTGPGSSSFQQTAASRVRPEVRLAGTPRGARAEPRAEAGASRARAPERRSAPLGAARVSGSSLGPRFPPKTGGCGVGPRRGVPGPPEGPARSKQRVRSRARRPGQRAETGAARRGRSQPEAWGSYFSQTKIPPRKLPSQRPGAGD